MPRSRTIRTLAALLGSMTLGTFALLTLETSPASLGPAASLAARAADPGAAAAPLAEVHATDIPLQQGKWRNIVIHDSVCDLTGNAVAGSHFLVFGPDQPGRDGELRATPLWRGQADGAHVFLPGGNYNASSIGICLMGDLAAQPPSSRQMATLLALVHSLQGQLGVNSDHVYLHGHGDLTDARCPGEQFPAGYFRDHLLTFPR